MEDKLELKFEEVGKNEAGRDVRVILGQELVSVPELGEVNGREGFFGVGATTCTGMTWDSLLSLVGDRLENAEGEDFSDEELIERCATAMGYPKDHEEFGRVRAELVWMFSLYDKRREQLFERPMHPITEVSWFDCAVWLNTLARLTPGFEPFYDIEISVEVDSDGVYNLRVESHGHKDLSDIPNESGTFYLPFEREWSIYSRAGTTGDHYGIDLGLEPTDIGWFEENSGGAPHPVAQKTPNPWGFYDILGNVWEWCSDKHEE